MGEEGGVVVLRASSVYAEENWATALSPLRRFAGFSRETPCSILRQLLQQVRGVVTVQRKREAEDFITTTL